MKILTETKALDALGKLKRDYRDFIKTNYEHRAQNCETCPVQGACCLDAHFVNVHITRLEAAAIRKTLRELSAEKQKEIYRRAQEAVEKYDLKTTGDTFARTYACPLFETGVGCLVHSASKPAACISYACYENQADLPPEFFQEAVENEIEKLNKRVYGNALTWLPLPVWVSLINSTTKEI
jgi:hypothetical protein